MSCNRRVQANLTKLGGIINGKKECMEKKYPEGKKRDGGIFYLRKITVNLSSDCKTERECTSAVYKDAVAHGYKDLDELIKNKTAVKAGDRIVADNMGKGVALLI